MLFISTYQFVVCCIFLIIWTPSVYSRGTKTRLLSDLLQNYDSRFMPELPANDTLDITLSLRLLRILDVENKEQILTTLQWITLFWTDEDLSWKPTEYDGIEQFNIPQVDSIWFPKVDIFNNVDLAFALSGHSTTKVTILQSGLVEYHYRISLKSSCEINVRYFPFDTQNCSMEFFTTDNSYDGTQMKLNAFQGGADVTLFYTNSSEFDLLEVTTHSTQHRLTYYLVFQRRPLFYVVNLMLPCCLVTMVAMLGFYIPLESGEKLTLGITVLLSMIVFLLLVSDKMPTSSASHFPLIGVYYFLTLTLVSISTAMTTITLRMHHTGSQGKPVPIWVRRIFFGRLSSAICLTKITPVQSDAKSAMLPSGPEKPVNISMEDMSMGDEINLTGGGGGAHHRLIDTLDKVLESIHRYEQRVKQDEEEETINQEWRQLAFIIDRFLLITFLAITGIVTLVLMLCMAFGF